MFDSIRCNLFTTQRTSNMQSSLLIFFSEEKTKKKKTQDNVNVKEARLVIKRAKQTKANQKEQQWKIWTRCNYSQQLKKQTMTASLTMKMSHDVSHRAKYNLFILCFVGVLALYRFCLLLFPQYLSSPDESWVAWKVTFTTFYVHALWAMRIHFSFFFFSFTTINLLYSVWLIFVAMQVIALFPTWISSIVSLHKHCIIYA